MIPSAHLAEYVSHVDSDVIAIHENGIGYTEQSAPAHWWLVSILPLL
jgi:hypothetical protein